MDLSKGLFVKAASPLSVEQPFQYPRNGQA